MKAKSFCVTEGEGHRDPVNTNTTSGRGDDQKIKKQDCKICYCLCTDRRTKLAACPFPNRNAGLAMSKRIFQASALWEHFRV